MAPTQYTKITLAERPTEGVTDTTFKREVVPFDLKPGQGQILVKALYASIDPAMRGWLNDARSYLPPVKIGEVMRALILGEVVETGPGSKFTKGDIVSGVFGMSSAVFAFGLRYPYVIIQVGPSTEYTTTVLRRRYSECTLSRAQISC